MQHTEQSLPSGQLIAERYRVEKLLGRGGMGSVYLVSDTLLSTGDVQSRVALKLLRDDLSRDEKYRRNFLKEVTLTRSITHKNVVRTFEVGTHGDLLFFTMEYFDGEALDERLLGNVIDTNLAVSVLSEIASGLASIHERGVVHRDLKPGNVLINKQGEVKISDFGIARTGKRHEAESEVLGDAHYLAPEVWTQDEITSATDVYALGAIGYALLTGVLPFDAETEYELMYKHVQQPPTSLLAVDHVTPGWANELILSMLSKLPSDRPDMEHAARALKSNIDPTRCAAALHEVFNGFHINIPSLGTEVRSLHLLTEEQESPELEEALRQHYRDEFRFTESEIEKGRKSIGGVQVVQAPKKKAAFSAIGIASAAALILASAAWIVFLGETLLPQFAKRWATVSGDGVATATFVNAELLILACLFSTAPALFALSVSAKPLKVLFGYLTVCGWLFVLSLAVVTHRASMTDLKTKEMIIAVDEVARETMRVGMLMPASTARLTGISFDDFSQFKLTPKGIQFLQFIGQLVFLASYLLGLMVVIVKRVTRSRNSMIVVRMWFVCGVLPAVVSGFARAMISGAPPVKNALTSLAKLGVFALDYNNIDVACAIASWGVIICASLVLFWRRDRL